MNYDHLLGRPFELGKYDCFTMVRDFYADFYGIPLENYARPNDWDADKIDIIGKTYDREGFEKVENWTLRNLNPGDLLCMAIGSHCANHMAIYVGNNMILHHKLNSFSAEEMLRDFWRKSICYVLRHCDVPIEADEKPSVSIMEILNARNTLQADS